MMPARPCLENPLVDLELDESHVPRKRLQLTGCKPAEAHAGNLGREQQLEALRIRKLRHRSAVTA
jgi:hypothetical protein